ncbi:C39 family peptidase [Micromonospora endolithica]|uniref:Phytochelatin synthase n=1 Tax=Micromonospora endolithica TaxID=230091 RepID=A0A3A9ZQE0_9ACTN|nr:C39 family peptidase [Micromonospora endolithica]RKN50393.1 phytochelatin synthase [Micromonospora endolithica]TWJ20929.1 peptidase C39-like protein [Micromonospora endolithica]
MNALTSWTTARTAVTRRSALGLAGLALVATGVAAPATGALAAPSQVPSVTLQQAEKKSDKRVDYRFQAQPNIYFCGPASTRIALSAQGNIQSQDELASKLGTTVAGTASAFDVTRVLNEELGKDVYKTGEIPNDTATADEVRRLKDDLITALDDDRVAVVNVIGAGTDADGVSRDFPVGHYVTAVAYDGDQVKIADPWQPVGDGTYWMSVGELAEWAASRGYSA